MNRGTERSRGVMVSRRAQASNEDGASNGSVGGWFPVADRDRLNELRLEERRNERVRIARELHDTLFQGFLGVSLQIQGAVELLPEDSPGRPSLDRALGLMRRVIDEGRDALFGLRSVRLTPTSLEEAFMSLREEIAPDCAVKFRIFVNGEPRELQPAVLQQIYMIAREAVVNALRHSKATSIEAEVEYLPRRVRVMVRDNGCGFDPDVARTGREAHWGLTGMRERAASIDAELRIWTRPGAGTEVEISVPDEAAAAACA